MRELVQRAFRGDARKVSRLHDFSGKVAPMAAFAHLPACVVSTLAKKLSGTHPIGPWLGYRAIRRIDSLLQGTWRVLEFGAGNSTPWLAQRCASLVSVEGDRRWLEVVSGMLAGTSNAELVYQPPPYDSLAVSLPPSFDFCLVDGLARDRAVAVALAKVVPGGYIYLDNADVQDAEHQSARQLLLAACEPGSAEVFVDFSAGHVTVTQGILARTRSQATVGR